MKNSKTTPLRIWRNTALVEIEISMMTYYDCPGLAAGLGVGTAVEVAKRTLGVADSTSLVGDNPFVTVANIERIVDMLCRVRGAALKLGQMISLQGVCVCVCVCVYVRACKRMYCACIYVHVYVLCKKLHP